MACIKQYPMAIYYDPQLVAHTYDVDESYVDKLRTAATSEDRAASDDADNCQSLACASFSASGLSHDDPCRELNAAYAEEESQCIDKYKDKCSQFFQACISMGNDMMGTYIPEASNDCHPVGTFARECRDSYASGRVPPNQWWLGPSQGTPKGGYALQVSSVRPYKTTPRNSGGGWNGTPEDPNLVTMQDPDARSTPDAAARQNNATTPPTTEGWGFGGEPDYDYYLSRELQRCGNGTSNYFTEFPYLNPAAAANVARCGNNARRDFGAQKRGQAKRLGQETRKF